MSFPALPLTGHDLASALRRIASGPHSLNTRADAMMREDRPEPTAEEVAADSRVIAATEPQLPDAWAADEYHLDAAYNDALWAMPEAAHDEEDGE